MAADAAGNLYLTDDRLGAIWRVRPGDRTAAVWVSDLALAPDPAGAPVYGANGIEVFRGAVYVSNPSRAALLRYAIGTDGAAGRAETPHGDMRSANVDDFAFDTEGNIFVATVVNTTVERIAPDGGVTTVLTAADGLEQPTAVAFDTRGGTTHLYVTNAAFFSPPGTIPHASLLRVAVVVPGESLPR